MAHGRTPIIALVPLQERTSMFTGGVRKNIGPVLNEEDFNAILAFLRRSLAERR